MRSSDDLASWIDLSLVPGLGPAHFRELLSAFGLPDNIRSASLSRLAQVVPHAVAESIASGERRGSTTDALDWASKSGNFVVTLADADYPRQLLQIPDPPILLYGRGSLPMLASPALAVVGSRNATRQGLENAELFARAFSDAGFTIVSGLALGIDAAAHRGGLDGRSSSIAVLGCGADVVYPKRNDPLYAQIVRQGAIVSEFPLGTPPLPANFPRRNRLISGLARGCLVVEAALSSGSLVTARLAAEQGREVFAVPGSIHSPLAKGCHALIKQGAKLVESAVDVLEELGMSAVSGTEHNTSSSEEKLLQHMGYDPCSVDTLARRSGLTAESISAMLLALELDGKIMSLPGGLYQRSR